MLTLRGEIWVGLTVAAGLWQIGEFSFILAGLGRSLGLLPEEGYKLNLVGALISITLNPLLFRLIEPLAARFNRAGSSTPVARRYVPVR